MNAIHAVGAGFRLLGMLAICSSFGLRCSRRRQVVLEVTAQIRIRTIRQVLIAFELGGCDVLLWVRPIRRLMSLTWLPRWHPNTRILWRNPAKTDCDLFLTTKPESERPAGSARGRMAYLDIEYDPSKPAGPGEYAMPFTMHPQAYGQYREHLRLAEYRSQARRLRILFAGNCDEASYDNPVLHDHYGLPSRYATYRFLQSRGRLNELASRADLDAELQSGCNDKVLFIDTQRFRIDQAEWMRLLGQTDFFLCLPGLVMPMCHNAVEALAVGTIPILAYPEWFLPPLCDSVNALCYSSLDDIEASLDRAFGMGEAAIARLRAGAEAYYDDHMNPGAYVQRLFADQGPFLRIHVLDEENHQRLGEQHYQAGSSAKA